MAPRFDAIGVVVEHMARTLAFYRLLDLDFPESTDDEGHVEVELPGGARLMFDTADVMRSFDEDWVAPRRPGPMTLAFRCADPDDVDRTFLRLVQAGHEPALDPFDAFWGQRYATVRDPDGNAVDLFAPIA
jgi:uncharacterized glyoxalase superfamily protein PhnB